MTTTLKSSPARVEATEEVAGYTPRVPLSSLVRTIGLRWRFVVTVGFLSAVLSAGILLLIRNRYIASVLIVPEKAATPSGSLSTLSNLVGLSGLNLGGLGGSESPQFYEALARSRPIQYAVLLQRYPNPRTENNDSAALPQILKIGGKTPAEQITRTARALGSMTRISPDLKTGIIHIDVESKWAPLSAAIANAYVAELVRFNRGSRQSQARLRREFLEDRVAESFKDLEGAEAEVKRFLAQNRDYQTSPSLQFEYTRLQRSMSSAEELYLGLRRQLDAARIAEVDNIPPLTIIQSAIPPAIKAWPKRTALTLTFTVLGVLFAAVWVVVSAHHETVFPGLRVALRDVRSSLPSFLGGRKTLRTSL
jgi:uncharacterized protein involved in exopolysaccharide biosynthesis